MFNIVTGRQLRAGRILAGLTQWQLAHNHQSVDRKKRLADNYRETA